ncbi:ABC transporter ATP-binding protein [Pseudomonas sp. CDFA 602]|uniref:ABC transporter ATP-binding protein n=1 Tax=Pseudomonas californiensis TaxID=2829823 RepID=UPI001E50881B|nr:ABC transporter ATP-binding protein [Pseudomonas californiensis]MCD5995451.1 ABC transporter ATP-binding protein [Pseudomonas californiensis]MCD6000953.1 ABC transporter ATP-binding protein [Pseudomonas californiensis]
MLTLHGLAWRPEQTAVCRHEHFALNDIDLQIAAGEFVGLIGPNGSGKTSLLRCAFRYSRPHGGNVAVNGHDIWTRSPRWCARHVAVVAQEFPEAFGLTLQEVTAMGRAPHQRFFAADSAHDRALVEQALKDVGLAGYEQHRFDTLSGGEKQRGLLARALVQQPRLMVLDEPTNHLDPRHQLELLGLVKQLGVATLASIHDLNLAAAFCDRLCVIHHGRLVAQGTPWEVLTPDMLHNVFGAKALIDRHPLRNYPRITWIP